MAVTLWAIRWERELTEREQALALETMPEARRQRLSNPARQREPLIAWRLLWYAMWEMHGMERLPEVVLEPGGKPVFRDWPERCFNLSHTRGAALAALSDSAVGVDIQRRQPVRPSMMEKVAGTADSETFFQVWTRREARSKRLGKGISSMLRAEPPFAPEEQYLPLDLFPGYDAGVAFSGEAPGPVSVVSMVELFKGTM